MTRRGANFCEDGCKRGKGSSAQRLIDAGNQEKHGRQDRMFRPEGNAHSDPTSKVGRRRLFVPCPGITFVADLALVPSQWVYTRYLFVRGVLNGIQRLDPTPGMYVWWPSPESTKLGFARRHARCLPPLWCKIRRRRPPQGCCYPSYYHSR